MLAQGNRFAAGGGTVAALAAFKSFKRTDAGELKTSEDSGTERMS